MSQDTPGYTRQGQQKLRSTDGLVVIARQTKTSLGCATCMKQEATGARSSIHHGFSHVRTQHKRGDMLAPRARELLGLRPDQQQISPIGSDGLSVSYFLGPSVMRSLQIIVSDSLDGGMLCSGATSRLEPDSSM
jgi:hypothetical protein